MTNTYGLSSLTFGVPAVTGYVLQTFDVTTTPAVAVEVMDENGVRKVARYDDETEELSIEAYIQGATLPLPGAVFTYNSKKYEVLSIQVKGANKDYRKVTIKGKTSEGITLP
jgi:hypothetical protein